jgi:hypothetical protein
VLAGSTYIEHCTALREHTSAGFAAHISAAERARTPTENLSQSSLFLTATQVLTGSTSASTLIHLCDPKH